VDSNRWRSLSVRRLIDRTHRTGEGYERGVRERGSSDVRLDSKISNGIFRGLAKTITVWESHCDESNHFRWISSATATNEVSDIQAMQHTSLHCSASRFIPNYSIRNTRRPDHPGKLLKLYWVCLGSGSADQAGSSPLLKP